MNKQIIPTSEYAQEFIPHAKGLLERAVKKFLAGDKPFLDMNESYENGRVQILCRCSKTLSRAIILADATGGFLTHPRNGAPKGFNFPSSSSGLLPTFGSAHLGLGYTKDVDDGIGEIPYPLVDDNEDVDTDNKTAVFTNEDGWSVEKETEYNYGNVDWKGADGDVLTYRGNPSRYWPVDQFVNIPGLSAADHGVSGLLNSYTYMTVFSDKIYQGGNVLATMPYLYHPLDSSEGTYTANHQNAQVLGAAINSDGVLVCVVKTCYNSYPDVKLGDVFVSTWQTWKDGFLHTEWCGDQDGAKKQAAELGLTVVEVADPGRGYWVEVIKNVSGDIAGGWKRLLRISTSTSMPDCNFFFSEDGSKAVSVMLGKVYAIEIAGDTASYTETAVGEFSHTITTAKTSDSTGVQPWGPYPSQPAEKSFRTKSSSTRTYIQDKSGEVIIAADYKGNELVTMKATLSGGNKYTYKREMSGYWGGANLMPSLHNQPEDRRPTMSWGYCDAGEAGYVGFMVSATGVCDPEVSINSTIGASGECIKVKLPACTTPGESVFFAVTAKVVDKASGLYQQDTDEGVIKYGATLVNISTAYDGEHWGGNCGATYAWSNFNGFTGNNYAITTTSGKSVVVRTYREFLCYNGYTAAAEGFAATSPYNRPLGSSGSGTTGWMWCEVYYEWRCV